jgi:hypothetical protein
VPSEHSQFYALYWRVALTLERRHLLISRSVYALIDSPCLIPNSLYTFGLGTFYSPCLQLSDQFNWFTHQLLTTSGCGRCCKPLLFHLERLQSHYAYVEVSMLYGFNAFNRTGVYLLPSNTAVENYT